MSEYKVTLSKISNERCLITLNKDESDEESFYLNTNDIISSNQLNLINSSERLRVLEEIKTLKNNEDKEMLLLKNNLEIKSKELDTIKKSNLDKIDKKILIEKEELILKQKLIIDDIKQKIKDKKLIKNEETLESLKDKIFRYTNSIILFLISTKFITILAMLLIATTAIFFDLDGWKENYHRFNTSIIMFMIISLYIAKIAIIKILSVPYESGKGYIFYIKSYLLSFVLLITLISMIYISFIGIYSSLAVNTTGDIKTITILNDKEDRIKERMNDLIIQIKENEKTRDSYSSKYKTLKKNMNINIQKMYLKKEVLRTSISDLIDIKEEKISGNTNKAINYSAELFKMDIGDLLKFINLLMAWTLEITYLALTWYFVRLK